MCVKISKSANKKTKVEAYIKRADKRAKLFFFLMDCGFSPDRAKEICEEARKLVGD